MTKIFSLAVLSLSLGSLSAFAAGAKAPSGAYSCTAKGTKDQRFGSPRTVQFWSGYQQTEEAAREVAMRRCQVEQDVRRYSCEIASCEQAE